MVASNPGESPQQRSVEMLKRVYKELPEKDLPQDAFINQCLAVLKGHKDRKNSPIIRP